MIRRPLLLGALVIVAGAARLAFWLQRGAGPLPLAPTPPPAASPAVATASGAPLAPPGASTPPAAPTAPPGSAATTQEPPPAPDSPPASTLKLTIPGIGLNAGLHPEGLRDGRINPAAGTVMWYTGHDRVRPGEPGTAVIAGHVTNRGKPDAFADLARVKVGDSVQLATADGGTATYRVVRAGLVDKNDLTTDAAVWGDNNPVRRLAIVTCDDALGFSSDGHRVANYVVIAEPA